MFYLIYFALKIKEILFYFLEPSFFLNMQVYTQNKLNNR